MTWSIQVEHLSKRYKIGRGHVQKFDSLYQVISDRLIATTQAITFGKAARFLPPRIEKRPVEIQSEHLVLSQSQFEGAPEGEFWALHDVSFRIDEGQRVGIIGRNGSGKSTLLKILSRITSPTEGKYSYRGRLISLLEVGTGFHPDLSGRENIYLNAKINGMADREIKRSFDDIVDFSELGAQIDTPIKRYSSGMYMRLAFSVAAHLESDILIVDEVLAVGDAGFQKKCMDKMLAIGNSGRTLLFVSHDMDAVRKLCSVALELSHGRIVSHTNLANPNPIGKSYDSDLDIGTGLQSVSTAISDYSLGGETRSQHTWSAADAPQTPSGRIVVQKIATLRKDGIECARFVFGEEFGIRLEYSHFGFCEEWRVRMIIATESGKMLLSSQENFFIGADEKNTERLLQCVIPGGLLNAGVFSVSLYISDSGMADVCSIPDAITFEVTESPSEKNADGFPSKAPLNLRFNWENMEETI